MTAPGSRFKCLSTELREKFRQLWHLIGNTPMVEIHYSYHGKPGVIYAKCEHYSLTGSIKDRMALYILYQAYMHCTIKPGDVVVEVTSGNTGIAFAAVARALGHQAKIIMPDWLSRERMDIIRSLGAEVVLVSKAEGGFMGGIKRSQLLAELGNVFLPRQFDNLYNAEAHERTTAQEVWCQLRNAGKTVDAVVAGVGTGGTIMGMSDFLSKQCPAAKVHPLEPAESPTLTTGYKVGSHRIQGISDEFIPSIVKLDRLNDVVQANDGDAIVMAQKMSRQLGLAVGISSGANVLGAIKLREQMGGDPVVVTFLCDSNKKYLSTDLLKDEPAREYYVSAATDFHQYNAIPRAFTNQMFFDERI